MTKRFFKPFWIVVILVSAAALLWPGRWHTGEKEVVPWRTDFAAARAEGERLHKPVFVYFTASWCEYCQEMKGTTWADAGVAAALDGYVPVRLDVDDHQEIAVRYNVDGLPAFMVLNDQGDALRASSGPMSPAEMTGWLQLKGNVSDRVAATQIASP